MGHAPPVHVGRHARRLPADRRSGSFAVVQVIVTPPCRGCLTFRSNPTGFVKLTLDAAARKRGARIPVGAVAEVSPSGAARRRPTPRRWWSERTARPTPRRRSGPAGCSRSSTTGSDSTTQEHGLPVMICQAAPPWPVLLPSLTHFNSGPGDPRAPGAHPGGSGHSAAGRARPRGGVRRPNRPAPVNTNNTTALLDFVVGPTLPYPHGSTPPSHYPALPGGTRPASLSSLTLRDRPARRAPDDRNRPQGGSLAHHGPGSPRPPVHPYARSRRRRDDRTAQRPGSHPSPRRR